MKKTVIILMFLTIFTKLLGFGRDILLSYYYGVSYISDAYLISLIIPTSIVAFIGTGIATTYIPMYSEIENKKGIEQAKRFTNNLINILMIICTVLIVLLMLYTEEIVTIFASGFEGEVLVLAVKFTKISALSLYFTVLISIFSAYLNIKKMFAVPAMMGIPLNLIVMLSIFLSHEVHLDILAYGLLIAVFSQMLLVLSFSYKKGFKYKITLSLKDKEIKKLFLLALPVIIGVSIAQINVLIDRTMASQIISGGISALNYAERINVFIQGVFVMAIASVLYPSISKMATLNDTNGFKIAVSKALSVIIILVTPVTVGAMVLSEPIIQVFFGRGAFNTEAVALTSGALLFYSIGMLGYGLREILSRAFYARQDTITPMINATIAVILNIVLNIILSKFMGINGLALATSISGIFCSILLFISLRKKIGSYGLRNILIIFLKIIFSAFIMGILIKYSNSNFNTFLPELWALVFSAFIGGTVYLLLLYLLRIKELQILLASIKKFFEKKYKKR